jgi:hypothetical protein
VRKGEKGSLVVYADRFTKTSTDDKGADVGLSGISCAAGRLRQSGHGQSEALAAQDSELGLGHRPLARRHDPLLLGAVQDQEEELGEHQDLWGFGLTR